MLKLKMMLVMMLPLVVVGCVSGHRRQCGNATASGVDNAASPRLADTAERDYFTLRRLITMQKQLEGTQKYDNDVQIELPCRWATHATVCEQYTRFQRSINA